MAVPINYRARTSPLDYFPYLLERSSRGISDALAPIRGRTQDSRALAEMDFKMRRQDQQTAGKRQHELGVMGLDYKLNEKLADRAYRQNVAAGLAAQGIDVDPDDPESVASGMTQYQEILAKERQLKQDNLDWQRAARSDQLMEEINKLSRQGVEIPPFDPATVTEDQLYEILAEASKQVGDLNQRAREDFGKILGQKQADMDAIYADPQARERAAITTLVRIASGDPTFELTADGKVSMNSEAAKEFDYTIGDPISILLGKLNIGSQAINDKIVQEILIEQGRVDHKYSLYDNQIQEYSRNNSGFGPIAPIAPEPVLPPPQVTTGPDDSITAFMQETTGETSPAFVPNAPGVPGAAPGVPNPLAPTVRPSDALNIPQARTGLSGLTSVNAHEGMWGSFSSGSPSRSPSRLTDEQLRPLTPHTPQEEIAKFMRENAERIRQGLPPLLKTDYNAIRPYQ